MATTALTILTASYQILNMFQSGDPIPGPQAADGLATLNNMMGSLGLQPQTIPVVARLVFPLVANQGGPNTPYTIGVGGNFNTTKPPATSSLTDAAILLGNTTPPVEVPRALLTDDAYTAIRIKTLASSMFTSVYYNGTVAGGLGTLFLWPVPNTPLHSLVLYIKQPLGVFLSLNASYDLPFGFDEMLVYNLARRLAGPAGRTLSDTDLNIARASLAAVKRSNITMSDLSMDPMFVQGGGSGGGYNILSGR